MRLLFCTLLLTLASCRPAPPPPEPSPSPTREPETSPPPPPLALPPVVEQPQPLTPSIALDLRLSADVGHGGAVLFDVRDDGVWAKSLDGTRRERLVAEDATRLWPDAQTRVLWLWRESEGELRALDLAVPLASAVTIATGVPMGLAWQRSKRDLVGPDDARVRLSLDPQAVGFQFSLPPEPGRWKQARRWKTCGRGKPQPGEGVCPVLASGAEAHLRHWAERGIEADLSPRLGRVNTQPVGCTQRTCGPAHALPGTHWWLVPAAVWSDCCRRGHQLYDPRSRKFLRLSSGKLAATPSVDRRDTVEFMWICPQGDALVTESGVVPLEPPGALRFGDADACLGGQALRTPSLPCPEGDQCEEDPPVAPDDAQ